MSTETSTKTTIITCPIDGPTENGSTIFLHKCNKGPNHHVSVAYIVMLLMTWVRDVEQSCMKKIKKLLTFCVKCPCLKNNTDDPCTFKIPVSNLLERIWKRAHLVWPDANDYGRFISFNQLVRMVELSEKFRMKEWHIEKTDAVRCPHSTCSDSPAGYGVRDGSVGDYMCLSCSSRICVDCGKGYVDPDSDFYSSLTDEEKLANHCYGTNRHYTCAQVQDNIDSNLTPDDLASRSLIGATSKPCPSCGEGIEHNSGCHHMTCSNCNTHFCWRCLWIGTSGPQVYRHLRHERGAPACPGGRGVFPDEVV